MPFLINFCTLLGRTGLKKVLPGRAVHQKCNMQACAVALCSSFPVVSVCLSSDSAFLFGLRMRGFENGCEIPVAQLLITQPLSLVVGHLWLVTCGWSLVVGHLAPDESPAEIANPPATSSLPSIPSVIVYGYR